MKTPQWLDCGNGTLLHPVSNAPVTTNVVELADFGRIFEVYHYGNEPEPTQRLILAAPELLRQLDKRAGNLETMANYLELWLQHGATKPKAADTPTGLTMVEALRICAAQARQTIAHAQGTV